MGSKDNEATVRACFENASQGNFDALNNIVTGDYVLHPGEVRGADGLIRDLRLADSAI